MKNVQSGINRQASTETPREHLRDPNHTNEIVEEEMHLMPISMNHDHLNEDTARPSIDDEPNIQELDDGFLLVRNGDGLHMDELDGDNTAIHELDRDFLSHGTGDDLDPKEVDNGTPELDEDFDDRDLWDFFHPFCGYGAHPIRLGPFQYGGIRRNGLKVQHVIGSKSYHGYTRYPELHEDWVEPDHAAPLGFSEADFALHFGPRPELDEGELGDNFIKDLRLPRVFRFPRHLRNARIPHLEVVAPAPDFTPLPTISPSSLRSLFLLHSPGPRPPRPRHAPRAPQLSRDPRPLRESGPVWEFRSMVGHHGFEWCGTGQDSLDRHQDPLDSLRNPFTDGFTIGDFEDDLRALNVNELRGPGALDSRRSSRQDLLQIRQFDGVGRPMHSMGSASRRTPEWASGRTPEPLPVTGRLCGMGRRR